MRRILAGKRFLSRIPFPNRVEHYPIRSFSSAVGNSKPTSTGGGDGSSSSPPPRPSLTYDEQLKALENLDFKSATEIIFSERPKKKKFGWDFHMVQLFFCCLPSVAVYLVAQYARSEMRQMDAELEKKKQAEFEAQAKEMERKAAEQSALVASNPEMLEVKRRLEKLEMILKDVAINSKKQLDDTTKTGEDQIKQNRAAQVEQDNTQNELVGKTSIERGADTSEGKANGHAPDIHALQSNKKDDKK